VLLTHGPLAPLGVAPSGEVVKVLAEATLALVLFSDASRVGLGQLKADLGPCLRLLGIGLPVVMIAIAGAGATEKVGETGAAAAVRELALGLVIGTAVGGGGGWLVKVDRGRRWMAEGFAGAAVLGLVLCSYATAVALHGNGFVAAFIGGLAFAAG
jgi:NhaP-type Na+/H+ or K+/H+ antiporter